MLRYNLNFVQIFIKIKILSKLLKKITTRNPYAQIIP